MIALAWLLDGVLVVLLVGLALQLLTTSDLFEAAVLFIAYGLTLSLAWVRLGAPDLALAEAALGAGVTGALFLNAYQRLARRTDRAASPVARRHLLDDDRSRHGPAWLGLLLGAVAAVLAGGLAVLLLGLPERPPLLPALVEGHLEASGVSNEVNAVLLNFRAWDTLLELTVLVAAVVAVWSLDRGTRPRSREVAERTADPVLHELARFIVPLAATAAVYLAWIGSHRPGGAFQAGALLAGAAILLAAGGFMPALSAASLPVRAFIASGVVAFLGAGTAGMLRTGAFLGYPTEWAHPLTLSLEGVLTVAVAAALLELFVDVPAAPAGDPALERVHATGDPLGRMLVDRMLEDRPGRDPEG